MEKRDKTSGGSSGAAVVVVVVVLLLLPVLYVLSIGPANWLILSGYISDEAAQAVYSPLIALHNSNETIGGVLEWYVRLFEPNQ